MAALKTAKARSKDITNDSKSYAKNLNLAVLHRILQALVEQSPIKVTNLAMFSRMNHIVCKKYLQTMCKLGWIEILSHHDHTLIKLSEMGIKIQTALNFLGQT